jgi:hypothetical protein
MERSRFCGYSLNSGIIPQKGGFVLFCEVPDDQRFVIIDDYPVCGEENLEKYCG